MKWKLNDAYKSTKEAKYECTHVWRETEPLLIEYGVSYRFDRIWSEEKRRIKEELNSKKVNKIAHLKEVERSRTVPKRAPDEIRGIKISDQQIAETFESNPRVYDNTVIF